MHTIFRRAFLACCIILSGCGYHMQTSKNPLQKVGIRTIFVENFTNASYRPGIEHSFTVAMVREIEKGGAFKLVNSRAKADAVLTGRITDAAASLSSTTHVFRGGKEVPVAAEYRANLICEVTLVDRAKRVLFSYLASGDKVFPGAVQVGPEGATVPLINDSEERIAYQFLSGQMMASTYQRMIDIF